MYMKEYIINQYVYITQQQEEEIKLFDSYDFDEISDYITNINIK